MNRVLFVAPSAYRTGGVATWLEYLLPGLQGLGWSPVLGLVDGRFHDAEAYIRTNPFPHVVRIRNETGSRAGRRRAILSVLSEVEPEIVVSVNIPDALDAAAIYRRRKECRAVMALHGLQADVLEDVGSYRTAIDGVIGVNKLLVSAATRMAGMSADRAFYAPGGVVVPEEVPIPETDSLDLLFVGRLTQPEKNIFQLPEIVEELLRREIEFSLRVVGDGPDREALKRRMAPFSDRVIFVGSASNGEILTRHFKVGSVLLIMSPSETGPLVAWEAMAHGVAVVTSEFAGLRTEGALEHGKTCLTFPVGDSAKAAEAIARLGDPTLKAGLIKDAYCCVKDRYSREASVAAWHRSLTAICERPANPVSMAPPIPPAGRLDRFLGAGRAEDVRRMLGLRHSHADPGGEWPHSYGRGGDAAFLEALAAIDGAALGISEPLASDR